MKIPLNISLLFFGLAFSFQLFASGSDYSKKATEDLNKINDVYKNTAEISMDIKYMVYKSVTDKSPLKTQKGFYRKSGTYFHSSLMGIETIKTEKQKITIDDAAKKMFVYKVTPDEEPGYSNINVEEVLKNYTSVDYTDVGGGKKAYTFGFEKYNFAYESITIIFHEKTYFLNKIIIVLKPQKEDIHYYGNKTKKAPAKEKSKLEIEYTDIELKANTDKSVFNESNYFINQKGKPTCTGKYKGYSLFNRTQ